MEKKQRKITIAAYIILGVAALGTLFLMLKNNAMNSSIKEPTVITELNQPYEGGGLRITVTDIQAVNDPVASDKIIIEVYWVFENISNKERSVSDTDATVYANDVSAPKSFYQQGIRNGDLAGKRTEGYYCAKVPRGAKQFELRYYEKYIDAGVNVTFVFDVPPVER